MHKDIKELKNIEKPTGDITIVYFSSISNNTHRFVQKLGLENIYRISDDLIMDKNFVLITPTYGGGGNDTKGSVPKQVIHFLNQKQNRDNCKGVVASGNTNFGDTFCLAGIIISKKLNIPLLYQFELLGTNDDVINLNNILTKFWEK